jgi:hypothetical protein
VSPVMTPAHPSTAADSASRSAVKARLTPKRSGRHVQNDEYAAFVRRVLRACSRRIADGDIEALVLVTGLADELDAATAEAVKGLRACGYSWAEISSRLGRHPPGRTAAVGGNGSSLQRRHGSHAGSHTDERLTGSPYPSGQPEETKPRSRTDTNRVGR